MPRILKDAFRIGKLISLYLNHKLTPAEKAELEQWIYESADHEQLFHDLITDNTQAEELGKLEQFEDNNRQEILNRILRAGKKKRRLVHAWKYVAAASVALLLVAAITVMVVNKRGDKAPSETLASGDVLPGGNKAVLTLANGQQIVLDSNANGLLTQQGNMQVINLAAGQLAYKAEKDKTAEKGKIAFNTLTTPRGGQYQVILPDGSRVWLNAASSLRYPVRFSGKERKVTLTGEAYFEVIHNSKTPFIVSVGGIDIRDIGTQFNVKAYDDEPGNLTTTVVSGAVSISHDKKSVTLSAGKQAQIGMDNKLIVTNVPDIKKAIAWKKGLFWFDKEDIKTVMRQIARWYNVDVVYKGHVSAHFSGSIHRNVNVSVVFKVLEETGGVQFKIEGRKIIVMP